MADSSHSIRAVLLKLVERERVRQPERLLLAAEQTCTSFAFSNAFPEPVVSRRLCAATHRAAALTGAAVTVGRRHNPFLRLACRPCAHGHVLYADLRSAVTHLPTAFVPPVVLKNVEGPPLPVAVRECGSKGIAPPSPTPASRAMSSRLVFAP